MSWRLVIFSTVLEDIRQAISYYQENAPHHVERFVNQVQTAITDLIDWPNASTPRLNGLRRRSVKGFPYGVWAKVDETTETVYIVGVVHDRRDPLLNEERDR